MLSTKDRKMKTNDNRSTLLDAPLNTEQDIEPNISLLVAMLEPVSSTDLYAGNPELIPILDDSMVAIAYRIAVNAHRGTHRKNGEPYINHPLRVAQLVSQYPAETIAVALLHDTVEDTELTVADLRVLFPKSLCSSVESLTHADDEDYVESIERVCKGSHDSMIVKLADTLDNSSIAQLECFDEAKRARKIAKYSKARKAILAVISNQNPLRDRLNDELTIRGDI
ncbi:HD domain-containing protein [Glutamicibacter ardleyensis]|uniref:HD domain-containing protein n=1 Tax=Glutamicibacter ardleyensis TaxID=225894 RepID=UPI003FD5C58B